MIQKQLPAGVHNISNESKCEIFRTDHISGCFLTYIRYIIFFGHCCYIQFVYRAGDTGGQRKKKKKLREKRKSFRTVEMKKIMGGGGGWAFIKKY